jgi:hypothetical protein
MDDVERAKIEQLAETILPEFEQKLHSKEWTLEKDENGIHVYKLLHFGGKGKPPVFRVEMTAQASPDFILHAFLDGNIRQKWDKGLRKYEVLEVVRDDVEITKLELHAVAGGLIAPREFLDVRVRKIIRDDQRHICYSASTSIDLKKYPPSKGLVRGVGWSSGIWVEALQSNNAANDHTLPLSKMIMMTQIDVGGWIPSAIVHAATANSIYEIFRNFQHALHHDKTLLMPPEHSDSHSQSQQNSHSRQS